jgi:hypothetical protein
MTILLGLPVHLLHGYHFVLQLTYLTRVTEWNLGMDKQRPMEVVTNSFCAVSKMADFWRVTHRV